MNSNLQNKLQEFSTNPPAGVWDKIAGTLDEDNFSNRLLQYEQQPPATAWEVIENGLAPAKVVPFYSRIKRPLRYAAVACFLAVILVTITLSVKRTEAGAIEAGSNTTVPTNAVATNDVSGENKAGKKEVSLTRNISNTEEAAGSSLRKTGQTSLDKTASAAASLASHEYVFFHDGDGTKRKVSKKLAGLVKCEETDDRCKQRLQQLREKMAAKAMTTDFTGILEMLQQLQ